ncbi:MAG: M3 family metallopeptidase, partial [Planctomycetota bacterium]
MTRRKKRFWQSRGRVGGLAASVFACACAVGCSSAAPTTSPVVSASAVGGETAAAGSPVAAALARADEAVTAIVSVPDGQGTFENTIGAFDDLIARLELDTNMTMFMTYVSTDAAEREAGRKATEAVESWLIDLLKREDLYRAVKAYADTRPRLSGEQKRLLSYLMRDFRRAGMALPAEKRQQLKEIQKGISRLQIEFDQNIEEDETAVLLTRDELAGMPDDYFENPSLKRSGNVFLVRTSAPQTFPVWDHCTDEATRKKVWLAWKRRGGTKNVAVLEKILKRRTEASQLLGYPTVADYEIEIKMAKNADNVMAFYAQLRPLVRTKAVEDYNELVEDKRSYTGDPDAALYPWDTWFYSNQLRKSKYAVDSQRIREYFPLGRVVEGLFSITQSLYGLEYREVTERAASQGRPLWHEDVRLFEVWDKATGEKLGEFYIDLFPRPNKYGHAAQWGLAQHKVW